MSTTSSRACRTDLTTAVGLMEIGCARVSRTKQDLERQVHALEAVGIEASQIFVDEKSGTTVDRPGLRAALAYARSGDVLVVHTAAPDKIAYAVHLREQGETIAQIVAKAGIPRTSLYRHLPPRPTEPLTADGGRGGQRGTAG